MRARLPGWRVVLVGWFAATAGCAPFDERIVSYGGLTAPVELASTPFHPQERFQCGPAALTTVLQASGARTSIEEITDLVYIPGREGSLQAELVGASRAHERVPYPVDGTLRALVSELEAGRPVLVLQNLGVSWKPVWHYAVVIGVDPVADRIILRSGTQERRLTPVTTFLKTWRRSDYWGIVALPPGTLPTNPNRERFLGALTDFESVGGPEAAYMSWQAAVTTWPGDTKALFGLANAAFALGRYPEAETHFRALLEISPDAHAAQNNLAYALARQGQYPEALAVIESLLRIVDAEDPFRGDYEDSWSEIASMLPPKKSIR